MDPEDPSKLLYENGDFVPKSRLTDEEIYQNKMDLESKFQSGGCFGNGPGEISKPLLVTNF